MKIGKAIKSDTQLIVLSVIILTIVTLSFSYSAFFTVQSLSTVQIISTGDLDVSVTIDNSQFISQNNKNAELFPMSDIDGTGINGKYSTLTILNKGNVDADFSVSISYDYDKMRDIVGYSSYSDDELREKLISFSYLKIGIIDVTNNDWVNFSDGSGTLYYPTISSLMPTSGNSYTYPIIRNVVSAPEDGSSVVTKAFKIYIWLSEETPTSEIGKYVYLKLNIKSAAGNETITEEVQSNVNS